MKRTLSCLAMIVMALGLSLMTGTVAADHHEKEVTVTGEVVDQPCYEGKNGAKGAAHKNCALACAKRGSQLAVLEDGSNTVYSITGEYTENKNEKLVPFVAEMVKVTGTVTEKDGKKYIKINSIKKSGD